MPDDIATPEPAAYLPSFSETLDAATPTAAVTIALIAINLVIFIVMFAHGSASFQPAQYIVWGANFGPLTVHGQWWRLLTACFVHLGIVHVLMNMYILFQVGIFTEKLYGNLRFLVLYLLAGVFGNVAGIYLHPNTVSAGASGAVFGVYGAMLAFLLKEPNVVPRENALAIARSAGVFLLINLFYGLAKSEVDMVAHIAGLVAGFVAGWFLARPLLPASEHTHPVRALAVTAGGIVLAALCMFAAPKKSMELTALSRQVIAGKSVDVGNGGKLVYSGSATQEDAQKLGKLLQEQNFFSSKGNVVLFSRDAAGPAITFSLKSQRGGAPSDASRALGLQPGASPAPRPDPQNGAFLWDEPETLLTFQTLGVLVAPFVGGPPLDVRLTDGDGNLKHVLHVEYKSRAIGPKDRVWYSGTATDADARVLGQELQTLGYFHDTGGLVLLTKQNGTTDLSLVVKEGVWNDRRVVLALQAYGVKIANAIGSHPMALHLVNRTHEEKMLLKVP